jgi:hypothetical protein
LFVSLITHFFVLLHLQPGILSLLQKVLAAPRQTHSTDFTHLFSSDGEEDEYQNGLIALAGIFGGILFLWGAILVGFTCRGKSTGCASGRAFEPYEGGEEEEMNEPSGGGSTYLEGDLTASVESVHGHHGYNQANAKNGDVPAAGDDTSVRSSLPSDVDDSSWEPSLNGYSVDETLPPKPNPRERRTRIAFIIFSLITLACVPLALIFSFVPLKDTAVSSDVYVSKARGIVDEVRASFTMITSATESSIEIMEGTPLDFNIICPQVARNDASDVLGVDIDAIVQVLLADYAEVERAVSRDLSEVDRVLNHFEDALDYVERAYDEVEAYVWAVPGILLGLSVVTLITLTAVVMAGKRESSRRFQRLVSYGVLPFFIAFSVTCWAVTIAAAVSAAMSSDACTPGSSSGSPDDTIRAILQAEGVDSDSVVFEFVAAYTGGCRGDDPTAVFDDLKSQIQAVVDFIWRNLTAVDSAGRSDITAMCGGDQLDGFLTNARDLARLLTTIQKTIGTTDIALDCDRINPLYVDAVHDSMCTDVASASAWGFVLFFAMGLSTMAMITLRASWRYKIAEDRIYDESDVADNMILDEHEEYLAYISRYKHEWQEYKGIDSQNRSKIVNNASSTSESENSTGSRTEDGSGEPPLDKGGKAEPFDPYGCSDNDDQSAVSASASEDISFLSLPETPRDGDSSGDGGHFIALPPLLVQRNNNIFVQGELSPPTARPGRSRPGSDSGSSVIVYATAVPIESGAHNDFNFEVSDNSSAVTVMEHDGSVEIISPPRASSASTRTRLSSVGSGSGGSGSSGGWASGARPPPSPKRSNSRSRLTVDTTSTSSSAENSLIGSLGTSVLLSSPPAAMRPSPGRGSSVQFIVAGDDSPASMVQNQVDHFTRNRVSRPVTPTRRQPVKMKEMAAKFDSPQPPTSNRERDGSNRGSSSGRGSSRGANRGDGR